MARRKHNHEFRRANRRRYPWKQWADGSTWEIVEGVDFDCDPQSLITYMYHKAAVLKTRVQTETVKVEGKPLKVVFQFVQPPQRRRRLKKKGT